MKIQITTKTENEGTNFELKLLRVQIGKKVEYCSNDLGSLIAHIVNRTSTRELEKITTDIQIK